MAVAVNSGSLRCTLYGGGLARRIFSPHLCFTRSASQTFACSASQDKGAKSVVFLGTPEVAAATLTGLLESSRKEGSSYEVVGVVSQPGRPKGRGNRKVPVPSPVSMVALENGFEEGAKLQCPVSAKDDEFLSTLESWQPDLCVTAAYGNFLPRRFLDIPKFGTLNIHPSLLPKYRGAAPVNRAILKGDAEVGVSLLYTVLKMDAGPVVAQRSYPMDPNIQAPELLGDLFEKGTQLLIETLDSVWDGSALSNAAAQNDQEATQAPKMSRDESLLDFKTGTALQCHNKVRAFAGWPGTRARFVLHDPSQEKEEEIEMKIMTSRVGGVEDLDGGDIGFVGGNLVVRCADDSALEISEVQPPNKKRMLVKSFKNGLGKRILSLP
ncbi:hypothetical protein BSKO_03193 [Bryopsis sp. KO-2023]|nr:hypothetical protein BSKO_03193 [Bryopsis sp. KO-2023]